MASKNKGRKWILSLGFSEAQADSFIENDVPGSKIEALAEVQNSGKAIGPTEAPAEALVEIPVESPAETTTEAPAETGPGAIGDYLCPQCKVTHRAGSKVHKRHLKLLK